MKIGILTLPFNSNYGGILQGYALQTALERMGHEACHINRTTHFYLPPLLRPVAYAKRIVEQKVLGRNKRIFFEDYQNAIARHTNLFIARHIHLWKDGCPEHVTASDFDAIVVGSDQVWRKEFWPNVRTAFLDFTRTWDVRRVAYAASFGLDQWQYGEPLTRQCADLLARFYKVSVREDTAVELCRSYLGSEAVHVADPTMLLSSNDYMQLLPASQGGSQGGMFVYLLNKRANTDDLIADIARQTGLTPFSIVADDDIRQPVEACVRPPVEDWLRGFANARLVVTNSFHGCVFAILFGKPFVAIGKQVAGQGRLSSLLSQFGFQPAILDEGLCRADSLVIHDASQPHVADRLRQLRSEGFGFLSSALG